MSRARTRHHRIRRHGTALVLSLAACLAAPALHADTPVRDHERARDARGAGSYVSLQSILDDAERREPGRVIDVELDEDDDEYEIEILRRDGVVVELEYDARTGELLDREIEGD